MISSFIKSVFSVSKFKFWFSPIKALVNIFASVSLSGTTSTSSIITPSHLTIKLTGSDINNSHCRIITLSCFITKLSRFINSMLIIIIITLTLATMFTTQITQSSALQIKLVTLITTLVIIKSALKWLTIGLYLNKTKLLGCVTDKLVIINRSKLHSYLKYSINFSP